MNWVIAGAGQCLKWTNVDFLSTGPLGKILVRFLIKIQKFSFKTLHLKMSANVGHFVLASHSNLNQWYRADSRLSPSLWETSLQCNAVSHWLSTSLESALWFIPCFYINGLMQKRCNSSVLAMGLHFIWINTLRPRQNVRHFPMYFLEWKCMNFD